LKKRIIFFGDCNSNISTALYSSFITALDARFELVGVVNTTRQRKSVNRKKIPIFLLKKIFNPLCGNIRLNLTSSFLNLVNADVEIFNIEDINNIEFVKLIHEMNIDYAFLMGCPQIFRKETLNSFDKVINYHNSFLPTYRGLNATSWAMTYKEKFTGYTFHYINENIDDGHVLIQDKIQIDYEKSSLFNEDIKTKAASTEMSTLLNLVFEGNSGYEQKGDVSYFSMKDKMEILNFNALDDNVEEMNRLINIWGGGYLTKDQNKFFVTSMNKNGSIRRVKWLPKCFSSFIKEPK